MVQSNAQVVSFSHVNSTNGLSDNQVQSLAIDRNGFLWIGTADGLNHYDGYSVTSFRKEQHPQMPSNNIIHLYCDKKNRIWLGTHDGIGWMGEDRKFHRVILNDSVSKFGARTIFETKTYGIVIFTSLGQFYLDTVSSSWKKIDWIPENLRYRAFLDASPFDEDKVVYSTYREVLILDYATGKIVFHRPYTHHPVSVCALNKEEIAIGMLNGTVDIVSVASGKTTSQHLLTNEVNGKSINTTLTEIRLAANGELLVATGFAGLMVIKRDGTVTPYTHDPLNRQTIAANNTYRVIGGPEGEVIVGTTNSGVSICNIYNRVAGFVSVFRSSDGNFFDNYLTDIAIGKNDNLWIGTYDRLIRWNRRTGASKFYHYYFHRPQMLQSLEITNVCIDRRGIPWVSPLGDGIAIVDEANGSFRKIHVDTSIVGTTVTNDLFLASDGYMWVAYPGGVYKVNTDTRRPIGLKDRPVLKELFGKNIISIFEDSQRRMWFGTRGAGVYVYDQSSEQLKKFGKEEGLVSLTCHSFFEGKDGSVYIGTPEGFNRFLKSSKLESFDRSAGLRFDRCEGFLEDEDGNIWIANTKVMARFNPATKAIRIFDGHAGISEAGFRPGSMAKAENGEMFIGTRNGLNYFYGKELRDNTNQQLKLSIYQANIRDSVVRTGADHALRLSYSENDIMFHFAAVNLVGSRNISYRYMLQGYDKTWVEGTDIKQARYASLPPGDYKFQVQASSDREFWVESKNAITLEVIPPAWQQWWFIAGGVALVAVIIYRIISNRNNKIRQQREEIEREQVISYFASSMSEKDTEEAIVWDVAKNCIGRLNFEDCVIYLKDEDRGLLVQKAAHGPKSPREFELADPIEISQGTGIVGSVALSGKAEIIYDTSKDERYIVDDARRLSEITVPILYNGEVLGVIDCEHSKKGFFTQKHLSILTTIASLCANKIVRARAEKEKAEAQKILMSTQRKMTEVEMQALRAQMNPHFIFNCLNSINRYIVKSDQTTASFYLTRFAKLIRLILDNSNSKNVVLSNELEALKLYIEMEALRFDKKFTYNIHVEKNLGVDCVEVPPLIIQPYVENAIWHGLLHKETDGHLDIRVSMTEDSMIQCIIEDNGIGRAKAMELKSKTATSRKSLGMQLTENRLSLLNKHARLNASVEIIDLVDAEGEGCGTRVVLKIPV